MKCSEKMDVSSVVAGCDAPKVFEFVEAAFDAVAKPVGFGVMANVGYAAALGRDHSLCAQVGDEAAKSVAVIAPVGDHLASGLSVEQVIHRSVIVGRFVYRCRGVDHQSKVTGVAPGSLKALKRAM
jgi:hypothetical protein